MNRPPALPLLGETQALLRTRCFGHEVEGHRQLGSTNTRAAAWAAEGAPEGSLVLAEEQTRGRGRMGRTWHAHPGQNLTFSLVLRPALPPDRFGLITLAAGVAVCQALDPLLAPLRPAIKWPNDVLLGNAKCCGMLLESSFDGSGVDKRAAVVLGIGLNVNQAAFPAMLRSVSTSLLLETGRITPRAPLLAGLLAMLEARYDQLAAPAGCEAVRRAYERRLAHLGRPVKLREAGTPHLVEGTVEGVTPAGALRLRTAPGLRIFHAGEVTSRA